MVLNVLYHIRLHHYTLYSIQPHIIQKTPGICRVELTAHLELIESKMKDIERLNFFCGQLPEMLQMKISLGFLSAIVNGDSFSFVNFPAR